MLALDNLYNKSYVLYNSNFAAIYCPTQDGTRIYVMTNNSYQKYLSNNLQIQDLLIKNGIKQPLQKLSLSLAKKLSVDGNAGEHIDTINIEVVEGCNLHCVHCYASAEKLNGHLSVEQYTTILNHINQPIDIRLSGGEPTLNPQIVDICRKTMEIKPNTNHTLITNGTMSQNLLLAILATGIHIQISIYAFSSETFTSFTGGNPTQYTNIFTNLTQLPVEIREKIHLIFYYSDLTANEWLLFSKWAEGNSYRCSISGINSIGRANQNKILLGLDHPSYNTFINSRLETQKMKCRICHLNRVNVLFQGDVTPCPFFRGEQDKFVLGNIYRSSLTEIQHGKPFQNFQRYTVDDVKTCGICPLRYLCSAGCCGETYAVTGSISEKYTRCHLYENQPLQDGFLYMVQKIKPGLFNFTKL